MRTKLGRARIKNIMPFYFLRYQLIINRTSFFLKNEKR